ncbi:hypothetical protein MRX96_000009 [Rhipicephalus microplus]
MHLQDRALHDLIQCSDSCGGPPSARSRKEASLVQDNYLYRFTTAPLSFSGLQRALFQLRDVYHAGGAGLPVEELNTKSYAVLDVNLNELVHALKEHDADLMKNAGVVIV